MPHQAEAGRVGIGQVGRQCQVLQQLALVEAALRVDARLVLRKVADFRLAQEFQLGDAYAVLARDHAIQRTGQRHDAFDAGVRGLQHLVVVTVDRDVGMHVAVTGMHVQRRPDPALEHVLVDRVALLEDGGEGVAGEDGRERVAQLRLPACAQAMVLQLREQDLDVLQPAAPLLANLRDQRQCLAHPILQQFDGRDFHGIAGLAQRQIAVREEACERIAQRDGLLRASQDRRTAGLFHHR